jgi:hypothetical protein
MSDHEVAHTYPHGGVAHAKLRIEILSRGSIPSGVLF